MDVTAVSPRKAHYHGTHPAHLLARVRPGELRAHKPPALAPYRPPALSTLSPKNLSYLITITVESLLRLEVKLVEDPSILAVSPTRNYVQLLKTPDYGPHTFKLSLANTLVTYTPHLHAAVLRCPHTFIRESTQVTTSNHTPSKYVRILPELIPNYGHSLTYKQAR